MSDRDDIIPKTRDESLCPCKSTKSYAECCLPFVDWVKKPQTAEQLMRSRYTAYFFRLTDYLYRTVHPDTRDPKLQQELEETVGDINWRFLTIVGSSKGGPKDKKGKVEFIAEYFINDEPHELHERSRFKRYKGDWKYLDDRG
ncbi:YchJ family metal-binding protein [Akkermansiaceae bacterium]|nr:YchJ family metal-binding protein [Akkermansiaceae bacterium]MDB4577585.1 YchJ family metal-binding protein [bacterium]MDA7538276.1 YchJ family metal-binding protein [Akkermansiaceae bacterium]MDA7863255.1 YchJ family metal-binding protein [Akkermansiaceae bacterium]MDA8960182.1 YchJ family metal-binding protein [Akkermansiaceae bacterium]